MRPVPYMHRSLIVLVLALLGACASRPVSVVMPEKPERGVADLTPISGSGDSSWRVSARADGHSRPVAPLVNSVRRDVNSTASSPRLGVGTLSVMSVNQEPTAELLDAAEGPAILRAQVLLDRVHFSSGVLNGKFGQNLSKAVYFFQQEQSIAATGHLNPATYHRLAEVAGAAPAVVKYAITDRDVAGPYYWIPSSVYEQEKLPCECYASAVEMLDERFHTVTDVLRQLNPGVNFANLRPGLELWVPNVERFDAEKLARTSQTPAIARIHVAKDGRYVHALAADGSILFHFPTTVGSQYDPSPSGIYRVEGVRWHPVFHYDPTLYSDVPDVRPKATLPPGPNSPVGVVWIATTKEHVGIHGTPLPHTIGLASSHGCVRLTNWDAARLAARVTPGVTIEFVK